METEKIAIAGLALIEFIVLHEMGHFLAAWFFGLDPHIVFSVGSAMSGFMIGVSHSQAPPNIEGAVIIGGIYLPLLSFFIFLLLAMRKDMKYMYIVCEVFFLLILAAMLPIPGAGNLDANKLISILAG